VRYTLLPKMHLSRLPLPTRILLTCFVLSIGAALWVGSLKYTQRAEFSAAGARRYLHGEATGDSLGDRSSDGLLPGEDLIEEGADGLEPPAERMTPRRLVDVVHPHLFTVPIVLFVFLHLLILTRLPDGWKIALHLHAFAAFAATFGLPFWIARSGRGAALFAAAGANLLASFALVGAILLWETWLAPARAAE
jgi:hypothetical protein